MKRTLLYLVLLSLPLSSPSCAEDGRPLLRIADGKSVSLEEIVSDLTSVPFVFVGEHHDNLSHHVAQLQVIEAMNHAGKPLAIGLEMFQHRNQADLDRWVTGDYREEDFEELYLQNWSLPWALYRDIFLYAREEGIPMLGLNVPPEITRQVARNGFASLTDEQLKQLPEVACTVDEAYMTFIRRVFGAHGHGDSERSFVNFCEAQMVWDTAMARYLLSYQTKEPTRSVVVLAGSGHAWRPGIPAQIEQRSQAAYRIILPQVPGQPRSEKPTVDDADYLWLSDE